MSNPGAEAGNNPLRLARNLCAHETVYTHWGQCLQESVVPDQRQAGKKNFKGFGRSSCLPEVSHNIMGRFWHHNAPKGARAWLVSRLCELCD